MLQKQPLNITFAQGLDLKTDPKQVTLGKFVSLENSVFNKGGLLQKRNGFSPLTPSTVSATSITTFNGNLTAVGTSLNAYSEGTGQWINRGPIQPLSLNTLPLIRSNANQIQSDVAISSSGLVCTVFTETLAGTISYKYAVADSITGQNIIKPTLIPAGSGTLVGSPRVFILSSYFIIVFTNHIGGNYALQYIALSSTTAGSPTPAFTLAPSYAPASTVSWDGVVFNNYLYLFYNAGSSNIKVVALSSFLQTSSTFTYTGVATMMSVTADNTDNKVWAAWYDSGSSTGHAMAVNPITVSSSITVALAPTQIISSGSIANITSVAESGTLYFLYELNNNYSYDSGIPTHYIRANTISLSGTVGTPTSPVRSIGLASKAFLYNSTPFVLTAYQSTLQKTYFLLNAATGLVVGKVAYSNGGGYLTLGLPNAQVISNVVYTSYLYADLITATNIVGNITTNPIYSQTGINLASFNFNTTTRSVEIGNNLNLTGGFVAMYDGYTISEQGFFLYPDNVEAVGSATSGSMAAQQYYYQALYQWTDNQGNIFRSAPSIPVTVTLTSDTSVTINVPTLRLTYKTANPVVIKIYRWSAAQQVYYQVQSPNTTSQILNDTTVDSIAYTDSASDAQILGNDIIYTAGGVVEDIGPPATDLMTLFNNRLWLVDSEDRNLLWYSKQVIEATPVEMSDLLTIYVAPSTGSQGSTGVITAIAPMDDKLIIFKENALYYINGIGPDNTGANSQYSDATFISSVVGCSNQNSIVFMPNGLMFQSDKGIWLLGRDLSTNYIGAPVETLTTGSLVKSALAIPDTNQIRFTMDSGVTLMYDYYFNQWGTFVNIPAISSTLYQGLHTYLNANGQVLQEKIGSYVDNSNPVLMQFTTGWGNLAGLQGYERLYFIYMLGQYISPFKLLVNIAYDYDINTQQQIIVAPDNFTPTWGGDPLWGSSSPWGGGSQVFQTRLFPQKQKCESFQLSVQEMYDPTFGVSAGGGLTLSGLNLVVGAKRGYRPQKASQSFG